MMQCVVREHNMSVEALLIAKIVDKVFGYVIDKGENRLEGLVREKLGLDPIKKAFKEALGEALIKLEQHHSQWVAENFDASFFEHEGSTILAQFLFRDEHP